MPDEKSWICFVAHNAYGVLAGVDTGHVGGIERQTSLMARWFAAHGYPVSMITWDEGQADGSIVAGVRVFRMCRKGAGLKGLRFFHPKWSSLCGAMRRADADIYYYNCGDLVLGQVVMWCRRHGRKSVYSVASDPDCDPRLPVLKKRRDRAFYRYGLRHVDSIVVQTGRQQQMLREGFGIAATVIPMPCEVPAPNRARVPEGSREEPQRVLWVGRISKEKRFEWLLDVAELCPQSTFDVVGASNADSEYARTLTERAAGMANVRMHGRVPHAAMARYYQDCHVLCCTSAYEGFPNTFLEAWALGRPIVSTFDPGGVVARHRLGWMASNVGELAAAIRESMNQPQKWQAASESARDYCLKNHALGLSMEQFAGLFEKLASRPG